MRSFSVWLLGKEVLAFHFENSDEIKQLVVDNTGGSFEAAPDDHSEEARQGFGFHGPTQEAPERSGGPDRDPRIAGKRSSDARQRSSGSLAEGER